MDKKVVTYRLDRSILDKLEAIYEHEKHKAAIHEYGTPTKTEVLENCIKSYYNQMLNNTRDADTIERIDDTVTDKVKIALKPLLDGMDILIFNSEKNAMYWNVLSKIKDTMPYIDEGIDNINDIILNESRWSAAIDEAFYKKNK